MNSALVLLVRNAGLSSIAVFGAPAQVVSMTAEALSRGAGETSLKSAELTSVSSLSSSRVGQPGAMVRRIALPAVMPPG